MSILIDKNTRAIVQGATGRDGGFHMEKMHKYSNHIVGGISPRKGGTMAGDIPIFNSVKEAIKATQADTSIIFVPAKFAKDAALEAIYGGISLVIIITEEIPIEDMIEITAHSVREGTQIIGPNCPGLITPGESLCGILPTSIFLKGHSGVISRSGTLTYEMVHQLTTHNIGQSTCVGIGGDPISGLYYEKLLKLFEDDPETDSIVLIGEIGGDAEERAANYIKEHITKPVVAFIAGKTAPEGKQMGHAGAITSHGSGKAIDKIEALKAAGVLVAERPIDIPKLLIESKASTI